MEYVFLIFSATFLITLPLQENVSAEECFGLPTLDDIKGFYDNASSFHSIFGFELETYSYTCRSVGTMLFTYTSLGILVIDSNQTHLLVEVECTPTGGWSEPAYWQYSNSVLANVSDLFLQLPVTEQCSRCSVNSLAKEGRCIRKYTVCIPCSTT